MILVIGVVLCNGYRLCPNSERDIPLLDAADAAVRGGVIDQRTIGILSGASVTTYQVETRTTDRFRLAQRA